MTKHSIDPRDTDGGITAAISEKETETPDYWRECAKGLHATVVKLQDAEEVLRARTEKAERERDEYRRSLERWRESAIRGRKERDEAKKFAGLWKEATREAIRDAKHVQDLYAASLDGMEQRLRDTETDLEEESNNYLHARRQLEDAAKTIRELRGQLVEQETRGFTAEDPADAAVRWMIRAKEEQKRAEKAEKEQGNLRAMKERLETAETRIKAVRELHTGTHWPGVMDKPICDECDQAMPCPTTRALNGDE